MERRRRFPGWLVVPGGALLMVAATCAGAADKAPQLTAQAARAERILIAVPQQPGKGRDGIVDVPPGESFIVEITRAIRGAGRKSAAAKIVNGGDPEQHPRYVNGRTYVFLLQKNPAGNGWVNLGTSEIPVKDGKVQFLRNGKVDEEMTLQEFEELTIQAEEPVVDKTPKRDTLTGRWVVALSNQGMNFYFWLVDLSSTPEGATNVKLISSSKVVQAVLLKSAEVNGQQVHLVVEADGTTFDFQGRFSDGVVRGSVLAGQTIVYPAWMEPTELNDMRRYDMPQKDQATEDFVDAAGQEHAAVSLNRFVRRHVASPLALAAFQELLPLTIGEKPERGKFEKLADDYLAACRRWGPRIELQGYVTLGIHLSRKELLPELALDYLNAAEARFNDDSSADSRRAVAIERGKRLIAAGQSQQGVELLNQIRRDAPFDPGVLFTLARQAEKDTRPADALGLYAELSTLPQLEQSLLDSLKSSGRRLPADQQPRRVVSRLWTEQHGNTDGLEEWLDEIYETRLRALATENRPARGPAEGTRVALCELFTGARSTPCVAVEAAAAALEHAYSKSELIVLRNHLHVPGPDPLANDETRDRFKMYGGTVTPAVLLNGKPFPGAAGDLTEAAGVYRRLRTAVESSLSDHTDLKLELSATADQGKIAISAKALGLKSFPANTRLQVVLAEDKVRYQAPNGIRFHEMVLRNMPTGIAGVAPVQGSLSFSTDVDLLKLKRRLLKELAPVEAESEAFDEKPMDLAALHLVAFLQNAETGEILQAAAIPVAGVLVPPAGPRPEGAKDSSKKPAAGGN